MGIRKNYRSLTALERDRFVQALFHVKSTGFIDQFAQIHAQHFFHNIHRSSQFLPWHREMLLRFDVRCGSSTPISQFPIGTPPSTVARLILCGTTAFWVSSIRLGV